MTIPFVFDNIHRIEVDGLYYTIPTKDEIKKRIALIDNDEYVISTFGDRYLGVTFGLDFITKHIHDELPTKLFNSISSEENTNIGGHFFSYTLSLMREVVEDWLCSNIQSAKQFSAITRKVCVEQLKEDSYKISGLITITEDDEAQYVDAVQHVSDDHKTRELKKRKMLLAAFAALKHERLAEVAYLRNDCDRLGVHLLYMFAAYVQLASYPALHDGKALKRGRPKRSGRPKEDRKPLRKLLEKFCPNYLNEKNVEIWKKLRKGLESTDGKITFGQTTFSVYFESTTATLETGGYIREKRPGKEEKRRGYAWLRGTLSSWRKNAII